VLAAVTVAAFSRCRGQPFELIHPKKESGLRRVPQMDICAQKEAGHKNQKSQGYPSDKENRGGGDKEAQASAKAEARFF
jgi:hypothetical protein